MKNTWTYDGTWALIKDQDEKEVGACHSNPKNGKLMAAAPELLAAARAALDQIGICCSDPNNKNWHAKGCAVPMLRAAILRAEGSK